MSEKLKIGIIGVGGISNCHIDGYQQLPDVELYAFCDINESILKAKGEKYGITRLYTDEAKMLAELPELDAVSVCTWNCAHADCTIQALRAGKHVLCEKPMAMTVEQAERMEAASREAGKLLQVGFVRRYGNDCAVLKDFIDAGNFGKLYYAHATYLRRNGNPGGWFGDSKRSGGGPLIDLGVHVIDLVRYLMGCPQPVSVYAATFRELGNRPGIKREGGYLSESGKTDDVCDVEDAAVAMIRFDNGAVLNVETSFALNLKHDEGQIQLFGSKSGATFNPELEIFSEQNGYLTNTTLNVPTQMDFTPTFRREIAHFVDCVKTGKPCRAPAEDGVALMRILEGAYNSARTGHEVIL